MNLQQKTGQKIKLRFDVGLVVYHIHPVLYIQEKHKFSFCCTRLLTENGQSMNSKISILAIATGLTSI
jgi:hypothetical protein